MCKALGLSLSTMKFKKYKNGKDMYLKTQVTKLLKKKLKVILWISIKKKAIKKPKELIQPRKRIMKTIKHLWKKI